METNEADAMEVEGAEEEEMMEGEVALQVQGTTFLLPPLLRSSSVWRQTWAASLPRRRMSLLMLS